MTISPRGYHLTISPRGIICPVLSVSVLTWFVRYIFLCLKFTAQFTKTLLNLLKRSISLRDRWPYTNTAILLRSCSHRLLNKLALQSKKWKNVLANTTAEGKKVKSFTSEHFWVSDLIKNHVTLRIKVKKKYSEWIWRFDAREGKKVKSSCKYPGSGKN